jgi:hypothetical protein
MSTSSGRPSSFMIILRMRRNGVSAIRPRVRAGGASPNSPALMRTVKAGAWAARASTLSISPTRNGEGSEVERAAVESVEMGEMIDRRDNEVDRNNIDPSALEADHRRHCGIMSRGF